MNNGNSYRGQDGGNESNRNNQDYNRNGESNRNNDYNRNIPYSTQISSASIRAPLNGQSQGAAPMIRHQAYDIPSSHQLKSEVVMVPPELCQFVADPHFQQILLKVKEQSKINFITVNRNSERSAESISISSTTDEAALLARKLLEIHFKQHLKIIAAEIRLAKVQTDLFSAQGEMASGMIVDFNIDPDLVGIAIGKKGARIKQVEKDSGVSSVNVDGKTGHITVVGPDAASVQMAREMLELFTETHELKPHQIEYLSHDYGMLTDIKTTSDAMVARVDRSANTLIIIGTSTAVRGVRMMLDTQMEYVDKQIEIEMTERKAREDLYAFKKQYNYFNNSSSSNRPEGEGGKEGREGRDGRDREGNRERGGNGNRGGRGEGRGEGRGGAEASGTWGHHDENHRDSNNRGERRGERDRGDRGDRYSKGGAGAAGGGERNVRNNSAAKDKDNSGGKASISARVVKAVDPLLSIPTPSNTKSKNRGGDSEAPLIAIPPPASFDDAGGMMRQANRKGNKSKTETVKADVEPDATGTPRNKERDSRRKRGGATTLDSAFSNLSIPDATAGQKAFENAAAANAAMNAPKMEKKVMPTNVEGGDKAHEPLEKLVRKGRTGSNGMAKEGKADVTPAESSGDKNSEAANKKEKEKEAARVQPAAAAPKKTIEKEKEKEVAVVPPAAAAPEGAK